MRNPGNLQDQFLSDRAGKILEIPGNDQERTGTADDAAAVVIIQIRQVVAAENVVALVDDGQAVNRDLPGDCLVAYLIDKAAKVIGPVARYINHTACAFNIVAIDQLGGLFKGVTDRCAATERQF